MLSLTLRLIDDHAELGLDQTTHGTYPHFDDGAIGGLAVWRAPDGWNWRGTDGEGRVMSKSLALTMVALHTPHLRHLTALGEVDDAASREPAPTRG